MAKAFEMFVKELGKASGVAAWRIAASYDRDILRVDKGGVNADNSKKAASRRYRRAPAELAGAMLESFSSKRYGALPDLVKDRTSRDSEVANAINRDAERTDELLREVDDTSIGQGDERLVSPWEVSSVRFCFDEGFRGEFSRAMREDGFEEAPQSLWGGIDGIAESLGGDGAEMPPGIDLARWQIEELALCEREVVISMVLASLLGPRNYAQELGHSACDTPPIRWRAAENGAGLPGIVTLRPVVPVGFEPWDFIWDDGKSFQLERGSRAWIGRDEGLRDLKGCSAFVVPTACVSRKHCELTWDADGGLLIRDAGATNGTLIIDPNGERSMLFEEEASLRHGSIICLTPRRTGSDYGGESFVWGLGMAGECYRVEMSGF